MSKPEKKKKVTVLLPVNEQTLADQEARLRFGGANEQEIADARRLTLATGVFAS